MTDQPPPVLTLRGVTKRFAAPGGGQVAALDAVTATIPPGRIVGLVGPDGAGKTTLLRLIAGLLTLDAGTIDCTEAAGAIGYMPQRFGLYEDLTVAENLNLYADLHDMDTDERTARIARLLAFTTLAPFQARLAGKLSGGMKQKLGLACALLARPRLLLLDEPSVGVDPVSRRELWRIVAELAGEGTSVLWATAYLDEAERCAEVLLFDRGRLLDAGPPAGFLGPLSGRVVLAAVPPDRRRRLARIAAASPGVIDAAVQGRRLRLVLAEGAAPPGFADQACDWQPAPPRLEDAFVARLAALRAPSHPAADNHHPPPGNGNGPAIAVNDLVRRFGDFTAVDHVSFDIPRGEIFGLLGPNGAGKSTIFKMLCGLLAPTAGTARVAGVDLIRAAAAARERLGYMAQRFSLYGELSSRANLDFFAQVYGLRGRTARARVAQLLDEFELADVADARAETLPLGHKQRLALAAALVHRPDILFLDEPTSGVDPLARREFWTRIGLLADAGTTVLVTSHFLEEAEFCDRLAIILDGRAIALGSPDDIKVKAARPDLPDPTLEDAFAALIAANGRHAA